MMYYWAKHGFAFYHIMKCAGTSVRNLLRSKLGNFIRVENPYYHEPLANKIGLIPDDCRIITCVRNPMDAVRSLYRYHRFNPGIKNPLWKKPATELDFPTWVREFYLVDVTGTELIPRVDYKDLLFVDGKLPDNLYIVKCEEMQDSFINKMCDLGFDFGGVKIHHANKIHNREPINYDKETEQLIRKRFKWTFNTFYKE